ncbi:ferritin family protein [Azotosporobacter soli]|uniref:ferritin-like domain-containing protein n=1 Tax=Azotosporobacter soli TaxID=3055040 RepID=UPI0031FECB83
MQQALAILEFALSMEKSGETFFRDAAKKVSHADAKAMFTELADWETMHQNYISEQIQSLKEQGAWKKPAISNEQFTQNVTSYEIFYRHESGEGAEPTLPLSERSSDLAALRMALVIEGDLHNFYKKAITTIQDPEGKKTLQLLAEWESEHQTIIQAQYESLQHFFWSQMGFSPF